MFPLFPNLPRLQATRQVLLRVPGLCLGAVRSRTRFLRPGNTHRDRRPVLLRTVHHPEWASGDLRVWRGAGAGRDVHRVHHSVPCCHSPSGPLRACAEVGCGDTCGKIFLSILPVQEIQGIGHSVPSPLGLWPKFCDTRGSPHTILLRIFTTI